MYEHLSQPLLSSKLFIVRLLKHFAVSLPYSWFHLESESWDIVSLRGYHG